MHYLRAILVVLVLIGGLMAPGGDIIVALPAALVAAVLVVWEWIHALPRVHWILVFVPLVFGLLAFHRLIAAPIGDYGVEKFSSFITLTLFSALTACLIRLPDGLVPLARVWLCAASYLTIATLLGGSAGRAAAFGSNPIWVSRAIAVGLVFAAWLLWTGKLRFRWAAPLVLLLVAGMFATGSRGPLLGAAVGILVILLTAKMGAARRVFIIIGTLVAAVVLIRLPFVQESRIIGLATGEIAADTSRSLMWSESFRVIGERPEGVGFGNWMVFTNLPYQYRYPHNLFLEVFVEHGVIIGLLFSALVAGVLIAVLRKIRTSHAALLAAAWLAAEIVNVSVSGDLNARTFFFALTLAILVTMTDARNTSDRESPLSPRLRRMSARASGRSLAARP